MSNYKVKLVADYDICAENIDDALIEARNILANELEDRGVSVPTIRKLFQGIAHLSFSSADMTNDEKMYICPHAAERNCKGMCNHAEIHKHELICDNCCLTMQKDQESNRLPCMEVKGI